MRADGEQGLPAGALHGIIFSYHHLALALSLALPLASALAKGP